MKEHVRARRKQAPAPKPRTVPAATRAVAPREKTGRYEFRVGANLSPALARAAQQAARERPLGAAELRRLRRLTRTSAGHMFVAGLLDAGNARMLSRTPLDGGATLAFSLDSIRTGMAGLRPRRSPAAGAKRSIQRDGPAPVEVITATGPGESAPSGLDTNRPEEPFLTSTLALAQSEHIPFVEAARRIADSNRRVASLSAQLQTPFHPQRSPHIEQSAPAARAALVFAAYNTNLPSIDVMSAWGGQLTRRLRSELGDDNVDLVWNPSHDYALDTIRDWVGRVESHLAPGQIGELIIDVEGHGSSGEVSGLGQVVGHSIVQVADIETLDRFARAHGVHLVLVEDACNLGLAAMVGTATAFRNLEQRAGVAGAPDVHEQLAAASVLINFSADVAELLQAIDQFLENEAPATPIPTCFANAGNTLARDVPDAGSTIYGLVGVPEQLKTLLAYLWLDVVYRSGRMGPPRAFAAEFRAPGFTDRAFLTAFLERGRTAIDQASDVTNQLLESADHILNQPRPPAATATPRTPATRPPARLHGPGHRHRHR